MSTKRSSLPSADELFRKTSDSPAETQPVQQQPVPSAAPVQPVRPTNLQVAKETEKKGPRHDEKVTFYCTAEDLTRLERARFTLRADHGLSADRGRIVRAALAEILDDFESRGVNSALVRNLQVD